MDETTARKAAEDVAAYVRTLATSRHRNVVLADQAVNMSRAFTEQEALAASPPLVDLVVSDLPELLRRLDGRTVRRFDGTQLVLRTDGASMRPVALTFRQRLLSAVAHPHIAYLLLSVGLLGLTIEFWTPGAVLPGVIGALSLLLGLFALQLLRVNYAGLLLILLGLVLFGLELKVTSYGLLTVGGLISMVFGSMMLTDSPSPELQPSLRIVLPVAIGFALIAIVLGRLGVAAQRQRPVTSAATMIGQVGSTLTALEPAVVGRVAIRGDIWLATSGEAIAEGARVRVAEIDGLTLTVEKA